MTTTTSPIGSARTIGGLTFHTCLACTATEKRPAYTTDPVTHVHEMHPQAANAVHAQFAPRHAKIVRTAR